MNPDDRDWDEGEFPRDDASAFPPEAFDLPEPPPGLEERVLRSTSAVVRASRWRRRLVTAAAAVLLYGVGFATARLASQEPMVPSLPGGGERIVAKRDADDRAGRAPDAETLTPVDLERRAGPAPPEERKRLLELAGNRYLSDERNVEGAMRCYRMLLDLEGGDELVPDPDDSWLLMAMKRSRIH